MTTHNNNHNNKNPTPRSKYTKSNCSVCRYQHRKCDAHCILAPYFPYVLEQHFKNAHKLFGVSKLINMIKNLNDQELKDATMHTVIYESNARAKDQVGGCYKIVLELEQRIREAESELEFVKQQLEVCKTVGVQEQIHIIDYEWFDIDDLEDMIICG
ncbi:hypothetical protein CTI12_AA217960 [Artemisia annua]|uniref:LOB domain-containing protein n=1 Tax=Artemisia annua TaxID=35608 RepID=A0A2U1NVQ0_ARTAN|nr:hypothetical protein CTI12_AA361370 [Artemisia annua]PWA77595.1 hypothetical protein CTI12_AA217960 [Artemisia annua]